MKSARSRVLSVLGESLRGVARIWRAREKACGALRTWRARGKLAVSYKNGIYGIFFKT